MTRLQAVLELVFAAAIWGFGFVATQWALTSFTTPELLVHRFSIAVVIGLTLSFVLRRRAFQLRDILIAAPAGISLGLTLLLQTIGLETTTATKSGFITTLYVILVPIFLHLFWGIRSTKFVYISCLVAIVGVGLLGNLEYEGFVVGDLWTLGCAVAASLQIIAISRFSSRIDDALAFNNAQSFWCLVTVVPLLLMQDHVALFTFEPLPWIGILCVAIGSSVIGFAIQVRSQRVLSATTASLLFLLEAPFAALWGFLLQQERLNPTQLVGTGLILLAAVLIILTDKTNSTFNDSQI